jgi:hypothetical protein
MHLNTTGSPPGCGEYRWWRQRPTPGNDHRSASPTSQRDIRNAATLSTPCLLTLEIKLVLIARGNAEQFEELPCANCALLSPGRCRFPQRKSAQSLLALSDSSKAIPWTLAGLPRRRSSGRIRFAEEEWPGHRSRPNWLDCRCSDSDWQAGSGSTRSRIGS